MAKLTGVIPSPKGCSMEERACFTAPTVYCGDYRTAAEVFAEYAKKATNIDYTLCDADDGERGVRLVTDPMAAAGEYKLTATAEGYVTLSAADSEGIRYGLATLLQMTELRPEGVLLTAGTVWDKPDSSYRGLSMDVARASHPLPLLKEYIDICWLYKVRYFHLHLADDQGYTLPSRKFPKATCAYGYTFEEIEELRAYAAARDVQIVPEVDCPGHAKALINAYPEIFGNLSLIRFHGDAIAAMQEIFREVCELFPESEYVHLGGDEGPLGWWMDHGECMAYGESLGYRVDDPAPGIPGNEYTMLRYLAHFITKMAEAVRECGKKPIVWEGFGKHVNDMIPKDITVMLWDGGYQTGPSLVAAGFNIINCSWIPNYLVVPTWDYSPRQCYDWDLYSFGSITDWSTYYGAITRLNPTAQIIGGQMCVWGDTVGTAYPTLEDGLADEENKVMERIGYIMENAWNCEKIATFDRVDAAAHRADRLCRKILGKA